MHADRFDTLTRFIGSRTSRRVLVGLAATGRPSEDKPGLKPRKPEELAAHLASYADAGISHVQLMLDPNPAGGISWATRSLELLDE